jgi:hypothetical protein
VTGCGTDGRRESVGKGEGRRRGKFGIALFLGDQVGVGGCKDPQGLGFHQPLKFEPWPVHAF